MARDNGMDNGMDRLKRQIDAMKAERVAQGLPADPPPAIVGHAMGWVVFNRCLPLVDYGIKYASLCDRSNEVIPISDEQMTWIISFQDDVELLRNVDSKIGLLNRSVDGVHSSLINSGEFESAEGLVRQLVLFAKIASEERHSYNPRILARNDLQVQEEVTRLQDDGDYFNEEYDRYMKIIKGEVKINDE